MRRVARNISVYVMIFLVVIMMAWFYRGAPKPEIKELSLAEFTTELAGEHVSSINVKEEKESNIRTVQGTLKNGEEFICYVPTYIEMSYLDQAYLFPQIESGALKDYTSDAPTYTPWYISLLPTVLIIVVMVVFFMVIMNQQNGGKAMQFGRSKARLAKDSDLRKVTFNDVAGLDEEKQELEEIVDFLKNPKKYNMLGARIPKGILLVGPPGTGKTYISKATAGEAGVPFFTISGSDFVEMFVGVGASRVRDLFDQAKKNAPCIIFIDEIDAVGRKRGAGLGGGHDEREQTLNQMLVEMDGFGENTGIIVLAATNRPDILDPALLRPGRFDRQIVIGTPDIKGREEIFRVHSKNKPLDPAVDLKVLARRTPGFTPADIENLLNEAALLTARRNGLKIRMDEIEEAVTKVLAGPEKKSRVISEDEKKLTAFHEAGHAVVAASLPNTDPVHAITIIPRGRAGGFTMILPKEDKYYETKNKMEEHIIHLLGGRVAEELTLDDISTGASNDIMRATEVARDMVTKYGFSEKLGPVNYASSDEVFLGKDFTTHKNYSEEVASEIDEEIRAIIEACYDKAKAILTQHMDKLNAVAEALLELETLDGEQFLEIYEGRITPEELVKKVEDENKARHEANRAEAQERERIETAERERVAAAQAQAEGSNEMYGISDDVPPATLLERMAAAAREAKAQAENAERALDKLMEMQEKQNADKTDEESEDKSSEEDEK